MNLARATLALAAILTVSCSRGPEEPTPRAEMAGVWELETVNGAALPAPSPEEENVLLQSVVMTLESGGRYSLASSFRVSGQAAPQHLTIGGTWVASDDTLTFHGDQGPAIVEFGYRRDGTVIHMVDEQGNEWMLRRQ